MAIRIASGKKSTIPKLQHRQMGITDDTEEVFIGTPTKNIKLLDEKDKTQFNTSLDEKIGKEVITNDSFPLYKAPLQPSSDEIITTNKSANQPNNPVTLINTLWEPLRNSDTTYIKRNLEGKDQSNQYDIWTYVFTPKNYEKTIIIDCTIHGWEIEGQKIVYRMMKLITENSKTHPILNYLREKVRIVVVPIVNPHGVVTGDRRNSRLVDLNRNADYRHANFTTTDPTTAKGEGPASEKETQILQGIIDRYASEGASVHFNVHNTPANPNAGYFFALPNYTYGAKRTAIEVLKALNPNAVYSNQNNHVPMIANYSTKKHGMHALTIEWIPGGLGDVAYSKEDVTQGVNFFVNSTYQYAILPPSNVYKLNRSSVTMFHHSSSTLGVENTSYEELIPYTYTFNPEVDGTLEVDAIFSIHNFTGAGAINYLTVVLQQDANDMLNADYINPQKTYNEMYTEDNGLRSTLSLMTAARVYASKDSNQTSAVTLKFFARASAGKINIRRAHIKVRFTPSDSRDRFIEYKAINKDTMDKTIPLDNY